MSSIGSKIACNGSASSSTAGSIDTSSHNHFFSRLRSIPQPSWLDEVWHPHNHRHERIATGTMRMGIAIMTREIMDMHIQRAPDVRGMLDYLPVADTSGTGFVGWRQKLRTWPIPSKQ